MRAFEYTSPATIDEALALLGPTGAAGDGAGRLLAGGTDLLTLMKADLMAPPRLVNVKRISSLASEIEDTPGGLRLGALTTLAQIETSPLVRERAPALAEAAALAATPQLRNMATIGGNLLQRPRCWYFRNPRIHCWLKGGDECQARDGENQLHALFGGGPCSAVHPSDPATALVALDAEVQLRGPNGERAVPIAELFALPVPDRRNETVVRGDELVLSIGLPRPPDGTRSTYLKAMDRKVWAFALVGVAAVARVAGGRIEDARLVLGGVAPIPWRVQAAERELVGAKPSTDLFGRAAEVALKDAQPLRHNAYKLSLTKALIRRALEMLLVPGSVHH
ncbi:MAG: FAD binding domain-containing protein [Chloroflexi bacterium]|nr:FAD binding domain-containing protein [Chloroflexota bacterium]